MARFFIQSLAIVDDYFLCRLNVRQNVPRAYLENTVMNGDSPWGRFVQLVTTAPGAISTLCLVLMLVVI